MGSSTTSVDTAQDDPWIVFQWLIPNGDGLFLTRPDGSDGHQILEDVAKNDNSGNTLFPTVVHPDWSPDGAQIVFERWFADNIEIWAANADGSGARFLVSCPTEPCKQVYEPAWSPDGLEVAYGRYDHPDGTGYEADQISIEIVTLATGERRVVARTPAVDSQYVEYHYPRWSPDGTEIVFGITYSSVPQFSVDGAAIAVARTDGSEVDAPRVLTDPDLLAAYPDWSPTGDLIVFTTHELGFFQSTTEAVNLFTIHPDGTGMTQVTQFGTNDTRASQPSWTPDGERIIFTHIRRTPNTGSGDWGIREIGIVDADGSNLVVLTGTYATHPRLQPTG